MIGIFGGTFDPIHHGHLRVALDVLEALTLEQIRFVPLNTAVHREQPEADARGRLAMLRAAIEDEPRFVADPRELERGGQSYTVDTLQPLRGEFPGQTLCLLLGGDAFNGFLDWREPARILRLAHLVVMQRPGYRLPENEALQTLVVRHRCQELRALPSVPAGRIWFQPVTQLQISASDVRARLRGGRSARYLTPVSVLRTIEGRGLYPPRPD